MILPLLDVEFVPLKPALNEDLVLGEHLGLPIHFFEQGARLSGGGVVDCEVCELVLGLAEQADWLGCVT